METIGVRRNLSRMAVFAYVVDQKSFSGAARALGLSKSAVSKQVSELEQELGVQLLQRTTRRIRLTEAGRTCYQGCARVVAEAEALEREVAAFPDEPHGTLRLTAPIEFGQAHVARALAGLLRRYPRMRAELELRDDYVDVLGEDFDVAVRIGQLADSSLIARKLASIPLAVVASPEYVARAGAPRSHRELSEHEVVLYSLSRTPGRVNLIKDGRRLSASLSGRLTLNNGGALREAVRAGLGIGILPAFYVERDLAAGRLVPILEDYTARGASVYAVYPPGRHVSPKVRRFIDALVETVGAGGS